MNPFLSFWFCLTYAADLLFAFLLLCLLSLPIIGIGVLLYKAFQHLTKLTR